MRRTSLILARAKWLTRCVETRTHTRRTSLSSRATNGMDRSGRFDLLWAFYAAPTLDLLNRLNVDGSGSDDSAKHKHKNLRATKKQTISTERPCVFLLGASDGATAKRRRHDARRQHHRAVRQNGRNATGRSTRPDGYHAPQHGAQRARTSFDCRGRSASSRSTRRQMRRHQRWWFRRFGTVLSRTVGIGSLAHQEFRVCYVSKGHWSDAKRKMY